MAFPATDLQIDLLKKIAADPTTEPEVAQKATAIVKAKATAGHDIALGELEREWRRNASALRTAEQRGKDTLEQQLVSLLSSRDDGFCCDCEEEEGGETGSLADTDVRLLARKVYDLLRYELLIERDRVGLYRLS